MRLRKLSYAFLSRSSSGIERSGDLEAARRSGGPERAPALVDRRISCCCCCVSDVRSAAFGATAESASRFHVRPRSGDRSRFCLDVPPLLSPLVNLVCLSCSGFPELLITVERVFDADRLLRAVCSVAVDGRDEPVVRPVDCPGFLELDRFEAVDFVIPVKDLLLSVLTSR
jgi:hypothetical protein